MSKVWVGLVIVFFGLFGFLQWWLILIDTLPTHLLRTLLDYFVLGMSKISFNLPILHLYSCMEVIPSHRFFLF